MNWNYFIYLSILEEEFKERHLNGLMRMYKGNGPKKPSNSKEIDVRQFPPEMDWRTRGAISPVKDQLSCGSCWAFTTSK